METLCAEKEEHRKPALALTVLAESTHKEDIHANRLRLDKLILLLEIGCTELANGGGNMSLNMKEKKVV